MNKLALLALPLLALPLGGCLSFGAKPPPSLMTLEPAQQMEVGAVQRADVGATITIAVPSVPQELVSARVPVHAGGTAVAYVKDALWVEPPARLFARLLGDTITVRTGRMVLSTRQSLMDPGLYLNGDLRRFGVDEATSEAVVTFDGSLIRGKETVLEKKRFEARVPVTSIEAQPVAAALNQAANKVAAEIADWVGK